MQILTGKVLNCYQLIQNTSWKSVGYTLRQKCPNTQFFWSILSQLWTEFGKIQITKTPYFDASDAATLFKIIFFNR